jgi:hypothetical protein
MFVHGNLGYTVVQLIKALCYKLKVTGLILSGILGIFH